VGGMLLLEILRDIIERDEAKVRFLNRGYSFKGLTLVELIRRKNERRTKDVYEKTLGR
jgi:hypothetical protein